MSYVAQGTTDLFRMSSMMAELDGAAAAGRGAGGQGLVSPDAVARFDEAMRIAGVDRTAPTDASAPVMQVDAPTTVGALTSTDPVRFAQVQGAGAVTDAIPLAPANTVDAPVPQETSTAPERAVRGLELQAEIGPGQSILDGLGRLRGVFDSQIGEVAAVGQREGLDTMTLMNLQAEVVRYSVLVDVSSKLAGKSTQALDSLMKGQ